MKTEFSVLICAYNESGNVDGLMDSLEGVRDVVVMDNGSADDTVARFKARGARVFDTRDKFLHEVAEKDIADFKQPKAEAK